MTAVYDGRLIVSDKGIEPCCAPMGDAIALGAVKLGISQKQKIVKIAISDRGCRLSYCPFCGAEVM